MATTPRRSDNASSTERELEQRRSLADFSLMLIRSMLQASYYSQDHPAHRRSVLQVFDLMEPLLQDARELTFITTSLSDTEDIQVDGVLPEPVSLRSLLQTSMGEHFVHKFLEYFDRNELVSFAIKRDIERDELDRFMGAAVERRLDIGEDGGKPGKRLPFDEILAQVQVVHIGVMCRDEIVGGKRRIPWAVKVALSRLRKDLKMVPLYCRATQMELHEVKSMLVQDVIRPLRRVDLMRDLLLNADLIAHEIRNDASIDVEEQIVSDMHPDMAMSLARVITDELLALRAEGTDDSRRQAETGLRDERLTFAVRQIALHHFRTGTRYDHELVRKLFDEKVLDIRDLPSATRRSIQLERWTDQFLHDPRTHLDRLASLTEQKSYAQLLSVMTLIFSELIRLRAFADAQQIIASMDRQLRDASPPFPERAEMLRETLDELCTDARMRPLVDALQSPSRDDRGLILRILSTLGVEAVPHLLEALLLVEDAAARRDICTAIEHVGTPAGKYLLMEVESFNHKWYFYRNVLMLLGKIRYREAAAPVGRLLMHFHPRVREEAAVALSRILRRDSEAQLLSMLTDTDTGVLRRVVSSLRTIRSRDRRFLAYLRRALVEGDLGDKDEALITAVCRALRDIGNVVLPKGDEDEEDSANQEDAEDVLIGLLEPGRRRTLFRRQSRLAPGVRGVLCDTLGAIGGAPAQDTLARIAATEDGALADRARAALEMLERRLLRRPPGA